MRRRTKSRALAGRAAKYGPKLPPFKVPTESVRWLMGKIHCGTPDSEVRADAMKRASAAQWFGRPLTAAQMVPGTVDSTGHTPTTTEFEADDITEATADHYNGRIVIWTSGALAGQATSISDYALSSGRGHFTVVAMTEAPANNDTFIIV